MLGQGIPMIYNDGSEKADHIELNGSDKRIKDSLSQLPLIKNIDQSTDNI